MTPTNKDSRRASWKAINFAGSINWALDLQFLGPDNMEQPSRPYGGTGCVSGNLNPEPPKTPSLDIVAHDEFDVDLNRLCKFACVYDYCPDLICAFAAVDMEEGTEDFDQNDYQSSEDVRWKNRQSCMIFKDPALREPSLHACKPVYQEQLHQPKEEDRASNCGCTGFFPSNKTIPWEKIGCFILISSLKLVLEVGAQFIPGLGKALDAGLDMVGVAAHTLKYTYPDGEAPEDAYAWWLSPCGGSNVAPDDVKKVFGILSTIADGSSSFKPPKKIPKGSGWKGDGGNPRSPTKPRSMSHKGGKGGSERKKCKTPKSKETQRLGVARNTCRVQSAC
ncbi:hypothetical protein EJ08DRAFT_702390 [Tothia fuscella]|uniref:Uncharacterized protein n=1 Tax=Tothia fuscella TaxID=1048955 RepID=A0A9P4TTL1_9PEZI|nr:hypothetical protein EJ08DRAFT_702390 [Tothia fuscella]